MVQSPCWSLLALLASSVSVFARPSVGQSPIIQVKNGTYQGGHNINYDVDYFLGIPFAQPPTGSLRLARPLSVNTSFSGVRDASQYGPGCIGFSLSEINRPISEDCLSLNVWRPAGYADEALPVLVWIYGGGYTQGLNADPRYNLTFMVSNSVAMGKPIIGASVNYRLGGWGFLNSQTLRNQGLVNLGLLDQRLALHWVQENIAAFGGDPSKVTIWGQSAGALSVGAHTVAYGGRDDGLFRAAIADSGGALAATIPEYTSESTWENVVNLTGCATAADQLACLRSVSSDTYTEAINNTKGSYGPVVDGDFFLTTGSSQLMNGQFVKVPLLTGTNTDEGTNFVGGTPYIGALPTISYPNETSFLQQANATVKNVAARASAVAALSVLYPDVPSLGIPHTLYGRPNATFGAQFKRVAALAGDATIIRIRRYVTQAWSNYSVPVYSYRFNAFPIGGLPDYTGTTHFSEMALVMDDEPGNGYVAPWYPSGNPFAGQGPEFYQLARLMSRMWISFVHDLTPNSHGLSAYNGTVIPQWPTYADVASDAAQRYGTNYLFDSDTPGLASYEQDTFRAEAIDYMNRNSATLFGN